jgi:hypothetical protein
VRYRRNLRWRWRDQSLLPNPEEIRPADRPGRDLVHELLDSRTTGVVPVEDPVSLVEPFE